MKLSAHTGPLGKTRSDTLAIPVFHEDLRGAKGKKPPALLSGVPGAAATWRCALSDGFGADVGQTAVVHTQQGKKGPTRIAFIGLGPKDATTLDDFRKFAGAALASTMKPTATLAVEAIAHLALEDVAQAVAEGAALSTYRFDRYFTVADSPKEMTARLHVDGQSTGTTRKIIARAQAITSGACLARDLVNECPGVLNPVKFAEYAQEIAKETGLKITVLDEKALKKANMGMMLGVAQASAPYTPPRLIKLTYTPAEKASKHIALVGKGVTFDSGGLDIKPAAGMLEMKIDMGGAAAVLGTMYAIGQLKPDVAVTGYLGCVENGIGGNAYHPGDVLTSRKGLTVEINNTDAEGRLVLGDCIDYALTTDQPDVLIDLATLTGACMVALGPFTSGLFSDDDDLADALVSAGQHVGEDFWRLPVNEALRYQLKSKIADTKNTGERMGGAITAALFLKQFVDERTRWAHLDIAGPCTMDRDHPYIPKGGAGFAVRTLVQLLTNA